MEIAWAVVADAAPFLMQFPRQALYGHGNAGQANVRLTSEPLAERFMLKQFIIFIKKDFYVPY